MEESVVRDRNRQIDAGVKRCLGVHGYLLISEKHGRNTSETVLGHPSHESAITFWKVPEMTMIAVPKSESKGLLDGTALTATLVFRDLFNPPL
jgi:hypothetical protein